MSNIEKDNWSELEIFKIFISCLPPWPTRPVTIMSVLPAILASSQLEAKKEIMSSLSEIPFPAC
jgi:hypothetical protein